MNQNLEEIYQRLAERYASGEVPWDDALPPPEVIDHVNSLAVGRALDLGCGYGRATIFMAGLGWEVDGIDFIPEAVAEAARRTKAEGLTARFHISPVTDLDYLAGPYDFALDVGCCHNMDAVNLARYRDQLCRLIIPDGTFLLFARMRDESGGDEAAFKGVSQELLEETFTTCFDLERVEHGVTDAPDQPAWHSAWFWFRRRSVMST